MWERKLKSGTKPEYAAFSNTSPHAAELSVLALALILLLILVASYRSTRSYIRDLSYEIEQRLHLDSCIEVKAHIAHLLELPLDVEKISEALAIEKKLHQGVEFYLVTPDGNIAASSGAKLGHEQVIDVIPLKKLIREGERALPVYGDDPAHQGEMRRFSAVELGAPFSQWFLYGVIDNTALLHMEGHGYGKYRTLREYRSHCLALLCMALLLLASTLRWRGRTELASAAEDDWSALNDTATFIARRLYNRDRSRKALVDGASGGLCSSLSNIQSSLASIQDIRSPSSEAALDGILSNLDTVIRTVHQILDLVRYESLDDELEKESFPAFEYLQDAALTYDSLAKESGITLVYALRDGGSKIYGDIELVYDALQRLIHNAIIFTERGGVVTLLFSEDERWSYLTVQDDGPGIADDELPNVFGKFFRGANRCHVSSTHSSRQGQGIGLFVAKKIVEAHSGNITVKTEIAKGTTVTIALPKPNESCQLC